MISCFCINKTREKGWLGYKSRFNEIADKAVSVLNEKEDYAVSVIFVRDKRIHQINRDYRNVDRVTDVITFAACEGEDFDEAEEIRELGDIFINVDAAKRQAEQYGHSLEREICFLFTHGLLHCFGYDHMNEEDEKVMFAYQREILDEIVSR